MMKNKRITFIRRILTRNEIEDIRRVTLWDVIINSTNISPDTIQKRVFLWEENDPCPQPFQLNSSVLEPCLPLQRYDYFEVNRVKFFLRNYFSIYITPNKFLKYYYYHYYYFIVVASKKKFFFLLFFLFRFVFFFFYTG